MSRRRAKKRANRILARRAGEQYWREKIARQQPVQYTYRPERIDITRFDSPDGFREYKYF